MGIDNYVLEMCKKYVVGEDFLRDAGMIPVRNDVDKTFLKFAYGQKFVYFEKVMKNNIVLYDMQLITPIIPVVEGKISVK